jgi:protein-tyrosine-phosphatase
VKILVLTETDACCGPMAAAFLRDYSPLLDVISAGRNPLESLDPMVITVMRECLIDLSDYQPKKASDFELSTFDAVYECPERSYQNTLDAYRELRDFIKNEAYLFFREHTSHSTLNSKLTTDSQL